MNNNKLIIGSYPPNGVGNPYIELFYNPLSCHDFEKHPTVNFLDKNFDASLDDMDIIHFHWLSSYYNISNLRYTFTNALSLINAFRKIKKHNKKLIFTCHNLMPHESTSKIADYLVRFAIMRYADLVVVHSNSAKQKIKKLFFRSKNILNIYHGNYIKTYPNLISPETAREKFGITPNEKVFLFFGAIRPYKGLENLIRAFKSKKIQNTKLLIAGKPISKEYQQEIFNIIEGDPNIICDLKFIEDEDVQNYFNAADICVFPFDRILTSGSLLLALSFGLPAIIPNVKSISEYASSDVAITFDQANLAESLEIAHHKLRKNWADRKTVLDWVKQFDWDKSAQSFSDAIRNLYKK